MKTKMLTLLKGFGLLFTCSLLIQAGCSKNDEVNPNPIEPPANADTYITWNMGTTQGYLASPNDSLYVTSAFGPTVFMGTNNQHTHFYAAADVNTTGNFPINYINVTVDHKDYVTIATNKPQVTISSYGAVGGYVTGTYSGTLKDSLSAATVTASGKFRLKRR